MHVCVCAHTQHTHSPQHSPAIELIANEDAPIIRVQRLVYIILMGVVAVRRQGGCS